MNIKNLTANEITLAAPLMAQFRAALKSYKGISSAPNLAAGKEELLEYLDASFPVYVAEEDGEFIGLLICRVDEPCVWVESVYVSANHRRKGVASKLYARAEELARSYGEETLYNYVHPNNQGMIDFLRRRGYTVLNLIEIRKPYAGEKLSRTIRVDQNNFDY